MRELRTGYFAAPRSADRLCEPGNISGSVAVRVQPCSARTREAMPLSFSDSPAHAACLRRVSGVDIDHAQSGGFGLVGNKVLQLTESPAMQPSPDTLPGLDVGPDVGQAFHADFACAGTQGFRNDGFAGFVVDCFDMPLLTTGDSAKLAFSSSATVGLKATSMGKVDVPVVPEFSAAPDLASAGNCEVILTHVNPKNATAGNGRGAGEIEDEVEIPDAFADNELGLFWHTTRKQVALMFAADERNFDAPGQSEQGKHVSLGRVGALVEVDGRGPECDRGDWFVLGDALVGLERLVGISDAMDGLAHHLTAEHGELLAYGVVAQMVQGNSIPTTVLLGKRNDGVAGAGVSVGKRSKCGALLGGSSEFEGYSPFHIGHITLTGGESQPRLLTSPDLKGGVSRRL